jgi:hypothetical protein
VVIASTVIIRLDRMIQYCRAHNFMDGGDYWTLRLRGV